jgi:hypothetical protein
VSDPLSTSIFRDREFAAQVEQAMGRAGVVAAVPAFGCSSDGAQFESPLNEAALEIQLMAARANASMAVVYLARGKRDCRRALDRAPGGIMVILDDPAIEGFQPDATCLRRERPIVCTWANPL